MKRAFPGCPRCAVSSSSIHSRYQRYLTDLPWGMRVVRLQLAVRKFVCRNTTCTRRIFTERLPDLVAPSARKTDRLITVLRAIGVALGGNAGARLAARLRLPTSPATLLRLVWGAIATAPSWSTSRRIGSWTCSRTARPRPSRRGSPSIRRSAWSAAIAVTCMPTACAGARPRPCRWSTVSISSRTSARSWRPSCSITDRRYRPPQS
jgi:transposase